MIDSLEAHLTLRARLLATSGLPTLVGYENVDVEPEVGETYVTEQFVPATTTTMTFPADGGLVEERGLYVVTWYGVAGQDMKAIRQGIQAVLSMFSPGTAFTLTSGHLRIRGDFGPQAGQIRRVEGGWASCTITIPWLARSRNTVAA